MRQIVAIKFVGDHKSKLARFIQQRNWKFVVDLGTKCEAIYPCHFLLKGVAFAPPKAKPGGENGENT